MEQLNLPDVPPVYRLTIMNDGHPENPREAFSNLGTMYCEHGRYTLGDGDADDPRQVPRAQIAASLPLYLYDHGGITMNTTGFSCPWDSGQVGVIYVTRDTVRREFGWRRLTRQRRQKLSDMLRVEVKTYDDYLTGEVFGYTIEKHDNTTGEWVEEDSCWGFYGEDVESVHCCVEQYGFTKEQIKTAFADVGKPTANNHTPARAGKENI